MRAGSKFFTSPAICAVQPVGSKRVMRPMPLRPAMSEAQVSAAVLPHGVTAPMVAAVETPLNLFLLRKIVTVVAFVFDTLGLPIEQQGNVLVLPNGNVGVEDACSGIRSLTGCLFAGSFLAAVFLEQWWKKIALVAAALLLAFVTNLARSLFLTAWAYNRGPESIGGAVHDLAGYAVLCLTVVGLLALLPLLNLRLSAPTPRSRAGL